MIIFQYILEIIQAFVLRYEAGMCRNRKYMSMALEHHVSRTLQHVFKDIYSRILRYLLISQKRQRKF